MDRERMLAVALKQVDRDAAQMKAAQRRHDAELAEAWAKGMRFHIEPETNHERLLRWINNPAIIELSRRAV